LTIADGKSYPPKTGVHLKLQEKQKRETEIIQTQKQPKITMMFYVIFIDNIM